MSANQPLGDEEGGVSSETKSDEKKPQKIIDNQASEGNGNKKKGFLYDTQKFWDGTCKLLQRPRIFWSCVLSCVLSCVVVLVPYIFMSGYYSSAISKDAWRYSG